MLLSSRSYVLKPSLCNGVLETTLRRLCPRSTKGRPNEKEPPLLSDQFQLEGVWATVSFAEKSRPLVPLAHSGILAPSPFSSFCDVETFEPSK